MNHPQPPENSKYFKFKYIKYYGNIQCFSVYCHNCGSCNYVPIDSIEPDSPLRFVVAAVAIAELDDDKGTRLEKLGKIKLRCDWRAWAKGEYK